MQLQLLRDKALPDVTTGKLSVNGVMEAFTLEPKLGDYGADCAIPPGLYPIQIRFSQKFHTNLIHIDNVPGRSAIEIHTGNTAKDTIGCVLVGRYRTTGPDEAVLSSDVARAALQIKVQYAQNAGEANTILVENPPVRV